MAARVAYPLGAMHSLRKSRSDEVVRPDPVNQTPSSTGVGSNPCPHTADLLDRTLGADVIWDNQKYDGAYDVEGVSEHKPLQFTVVPSAPMRTRKESPAYLDVIAVPVISMETGRPDDSPFYAVDDRKRAHGFKRVPEEASKVLLLVPIPVGMLLPDQGSGGDSKQRLVIVLAQWPDIDQLSTQRGPYFPERQRREHTTKSGAVGTAV